MPRKISPKVVVLGKVIQANPDTTFLMELDDGKRIRGYLSGSTTKYYIRLRNGDAVRLQLSASDPTIGRITRVFLASSKQLVEGKIIEVLPGAMFRVELDSGARVVAVCKGTTKKYQWQLMTDQRVKVEIPFIQSSSGKIVHVFLGSELSGDTTSPSE
jgi:translation initiation factor IF-1